MVNREQPSTQESNGPHDALVVEDNRLVAETIADGLNVLGYESVKTVSTVNAALEAVGNNDIDIAVLETDVRGHSTEPVLDALNATQVPHVIASSDRSNPLPGHAPYLRKPFSFYQLEAAIEQAIEQASVGYWYLLR